MGGMASVPDPDATLCRQCGYPLTGLPPDGRCPECGTPVGETLGQVRRPSRFEQRLGVRSYLATGLDVVASPTRFFSGLTTRPSPSDAAYGRRFGRQSVRLAVVTMMGALTFHFGLVLPGGPPTIRADVAFFVLLVGMYLGTLVIRDVAARLTAFEARQRGLRLPLPVVRRCLAYQSACLVVVALVVLAYVAVAAVLLESGAVGGEWVTWYVYGLAALVPAAGVYLFLTYWAAMRAVMYANS